MKKLMFLLVTALGTYHVQAMQQPTYQSEIAPAIRTQSSAYTSPASQAAYLPSFTMLLHAIGIDQTKENLSNPFSSISLPPLQPQVSATRTIALFESEQPPLLSSTSAVIAAQTRQHCASELVKMPTFTRISLQASMAATLSCTPITNTVQPQTIMAPAANATQCESTISTTRTNKLCYKTKRHIDNKKITVFCRKYRRGNTKSFTCRYPGCTFICNDERQFVEHGLKDHC